MQTKQQIEELEAAIAATQESLNALRMLGFIANESELVDRITELSGFLSAKRLAIVTERDYAGGSSE